MYIIYSLFLTIAFILMAPLFLLRTDKYASGFRQRLGNYPDFENKRGPVIWLHCVSVGETNAARPLVDRITEEFPGIRIIVSTTTRTGQELAQKVFADNSDAIFYFPFDWKFSVTKALEHFKPTAVLLMETEIWPRFIREAKRSDVKIVVVNGRLSERSARRYSKGGAFIRSVLANIDLALMQAVPDAQRIVTLGMQPTGTKVTGNLKFDQQPSIDESGLSLELRDRFDISRNRPLIIAASTHAPEESWILEAFAECLIDPPHPKPRLLIAPRHPERFAEVAELARSFGVITHRNFRPFSVVRRSNIESDSDKIADVILLDTIGELRAAYRLAEIVFVGGSMIPHGGQSVLEPGSAGKATVTGPYTHNFDEVVRTFVENSALIQLSETRHERVVDDIFLAFSDLLEDSEARNAIGRNALSVMNANKGATAKTVAELRELLRRNSI
ncbi:MAG: 3-deoxy-D-manno-octulosonic acid transferase [Pyrinomonadaceae bacterium]